MLKLRRIALLWFLLIGSTLAAQAARRPRPLTTPETEARNEVFEPSLSGQVREARRITHFLADVLTLSREQLQAVESFTRAERWALALAATAGQAAQAQREYRLAVYHVLDTRQLSTYQALCQRLAGTAQALDGTELAIR
ncbi:hypothetical protein Q5H92_16505 [Hymenobacter sp. M29]|uniref:DUF4476 domain-containing protein n=1 Tax=Hymenobacter mellowenesis TaxID=3063995 RepID=A0ABT9AF26_9BACT|nr:hypothetical protein [Hymenobacter sp. M29]MDO7847969.1 hypothetical protein [Hymenobacter sp. M29]